MKKLILMAIMVLSSLFAVAQKNKTIVYKTESVKIQQYDWDWSDPFPIDAFIVLDMNNISIIGRERITLSLNSPMKDYRIYFMGHDCEVFEVSCIDEDGLRCLVQFVYVGDTEVAFMLISYADKAINYSLDKIVK